MKCQAIGYFRFASPVIYSSPHGQLSSPGCIPGQEGPLHCCVAVFFFFFLMWITCFFKLFKIFFIIFLLFCVSVFVLWGIWDLISPTSDRTHTHWFGRRSLKHWITKEVQCFCLGLDPGILILSKTCKDKIKMVAWNIFNCLSCTRHCPKIFTWSKLI